MARWVTTMTAERLCRESFETRRLAIVLEATDSAAARSLAEGRLSRLYPAREGWTDRAVVNVFEDVDP
jgi:hypothetical protein